MRLPLRQNCPQYWRGELVAIRTPRAGTSASTGSPQTLPGAGDGAGIAVEEGDIQRSNIDAQLERRGRDNTLKFSGPHLCFRVTPLAGNIATPIGGNAGPAPWRPAAAPRGARPAVAERGAGAKRRRRGGEEGLWNSYPLTPPLLPSPLPAAVVARGAGDVPARRDGLPQPCAVWTGG